MSTAMMKETYIIAVSDKMGFYDSFDKIFIKDGSMVEKINEFLKENSYVFIEYPNYEDIYFDGKANGSLTIYGYKKSTFQKAFLGINDEIDSYINLHMPMSGITFAIVIIENRLPKTKEIKCILTYP